MDTPTILDANGTVIARREPTALAAVEPEAAGGIVGMLERLAANPDVDVAKLERLIAMQERVLDRNAKAAFDAAFARMQPEIPVIAERGETDKTTYATLEDIVEVVRPILGKHGFSLSHRTSYPEANKVRVVGVLTHEEGHVRESEFIAGADATGSKNAIQALGSSNAYGRRYTTFDLLGITTRKSTGRDDDGETSEQFKQPADPEGFDDWIETLRDSAVAGTFSTVFNKATQAMRTHLIKTRPGEYKQLRDVAAKTYEAGKR